MCIGRGGCVIKEMQNKSGTRIQIPSQPVPGQGFRVATVSGQPEACQQVKQMIEMIVTEQSSQGVMSGANFSSGFSQPGGGQGMYGQQGGYGQQQYGGGAYGQQGGGAFGQGGGQQQGGGQKDYSAEWAAYYAQQAQQGGGAAAGAPAPAPGAPAPAPGAPAPAPGATQDGQQPAADAYYDAFYRYAIYYGEEAARQYYGAWSPPPGSKNPYANGGAGAAGAPAAGSPPSGQASSAPAPSSSDVQDSSVRAGVSNLPAWMTNKDSK